MRFHVARQPIFNKKLQVYGYELLYRHSDAENFYNPPAAVGGDEASSNVIINSFYNLGIDEMTGGRKAFINFTGTFLTQEIATLLPSQTLVVEILETVESSPEIIEHCRELKRLGYEIALDDFVLSPENAELVEFADIIKFDFMNTSIPEIIQMIKKIDKPSLRLLAEKIETREIYEKAVELGFVYFQGYFFSKPVIVSGQDLRPLPVSCLRLIQMVNKPDFSFRAVARVIMRDVSLSYQLLKLVNSVAFGYYEKIKTVHHALVALGTKEVRKWVSLMSMMGINSGQPKELNRTSLIRAKFCEGISTSMRNHADETDLFMTGLFSIMDAIMGRPFDLIFRDISVSEETYDALVNKTGPYRPYIELIEAYEAGDWVLMDNLSKNLSILSDTAADAYQEAIRWCNDILGDGDQPSEEGGGGSAPK